ncbi:MAG: cell division protein SepF, partial [Rivularia sp. (in: cyanobacteria)]
MNNIFSRLRDFVGLNEPVEYEYYEEEPDTEGYEN